ncbi:MAG: acyltransferase [Sphingomonas sp.]|nr:acyltransferase [Sphingomonas sp.]RZV53044.1 MAG: acyltransferase [Sphingomonadaceae bacterium]
MNEPNFLPEDRRLGLLSRLVWWLLIRLYKGLGWRAVGDMPDAPKFVIAGASHTSNWDFMVFLGTVHAKGVRPRFIGKQSLFKWPLRGFMRDMGGIPVDRSKRADLVRQVTDAFDRHQDFKLIIAIEGTRSPTEKWRTGFYHIAMAADVPIVCAGPDYDHKLGVIGPIIHPTGDYEADMAPAFEFFKRLRPRHPENALFPDGGPFSDEPHGIE